MPDLLATVDELRLFMDDPTLDEERSALLLRLAGGEVRAYTGNLFDYVEGEVRILNGTGTTVLLLPEVPVTDVTALFEAAGRSDEVELAGPLDTSPVWEWDEDGVIVRIDGGVFARRRRWYSVTNDHGFEVSPDEVKAVVLRMAAGVFDNPDGIRQETLGKYSYTVAGDSAGLGLTAADRRLLDPYFISSRMRGGTAVGSGS